MIRFLPILLLCGCVNLNKDLQPSDTALNESKRDWIAVYRHEIKAAVENQDEDAYNFFFEQYMKERIRLYKEKIRNEK